MIDIINSKPLEIPPQFLSGSVNGQGILVVQTATLGTLIHTAVAGTVKRDRVWLYAYNGHTANVVLTIEWGGVSVPANVIVQTIPFKAGLVIIRDGGLLNNGRSITAFAATTNVISIYGDVTTLG